MDISTIVPAAIFLFTSRRWRSNTTANSIELSYGLKGDANADGTVNFTDFSRMLQNYGAKPPALGFDTALGDFNYDNSVNFADFSLLLQNYGQTLLEEESAAASWIKPV